MALPQIAFNPLGQRVVLASFEEQRKRSAKAAALSEAHFGSAKDVIASTLQRQESAAGSGDLSFRDFVRVLAPFAPKAPADTKYRFAFNIYDFDGDGKLGKGDLKQLMKLLLPDSTEEELIEYAVDMTLKEADEDRDGYLTFGEFRQVVGTSSLKAKLTINF